MARMQWADEGRGNHNPQVVVSPGIIETQAGATVRLDASKSTDADGDNLTFRWWQQPEIGSAKAVIDHADQSVAVVHIPAGAAGETIHLVCEVHDDGPFQLVAYRRIIIYVN
jgi:hypothetical protein